MADAKYTPPAIVSEILKKYDAAKGHHDLFVRAYERRERSYRGVLEASSQASKWKHRNHPPYAFNLIETIVSNTVEMGLRFDVRPAPHVNASFEEATKMLTGAEAVGQLLRHEHRVDEMDYKQRPLFLSAAIGGMGIGKSYWNLIEGTVRKQGVKNVPVYDAEGNVAIEVPTIVEIQEQGVLRDHSTLEAVDPRDFILHESARALQPWEPGGAQHLFHRCWYSFEQLKMWERAGFVKNVDVLKESLSFDNEYADRETSLWDINRTKDLIEVLEYWCMRNGVVKRTLVGNRVVLLRDEEDSPFWHGGYPFVIASSMPQLFTVRGTSDVELIEQIQEMLWETANQRFDNIELINNAILKIRSDVDDPDAFEHYPGARWPVDSMDQAEYMIPPYQLAEVTLRAEALLKGDLQNVTSAAPFASGSDSATVDNKTATGASIVMNAAQQRLIAKKYQAQQGLKQEANMRIKNCQQFITDRKLVHIIGEDGAAAFRELSPEQIQGEYVAELEPMGESNMRQERRAEATQIFQVMSQAAPLMAASGVPFNMKELATWMLKKWGIDDCERFFSQKPESSGAMQAPGGGGGGQPQQPTEPNLGTTAATAVDASSPSTTGGVSMSPSVAMSRALAMSGGANNAGGR